MSIDYTAEDFAGASFARHVGGRTAARTDNPGVASPWRSITRSAGSPRWMTDEEMAAGGWVPVVEATEVMQNRQIDAEAHLDQIEWLSKRLAAAGDQIESRRLVLEDLREENYRLERILQAPLTLEALEAAWAAAEQADECREGDVLIIRDDEDNYLVRRMGDRSHLDSTARILSHAPREPWADLADVLRGTVWARLSGDVDGLAAAVHAAGWRKGGGDGE